MQRAAWSVVLLAVALCAAAASVDAVTSTPAGNPHVDLTVTAPNFNGTDVAANIATWLAANTGLGAKFGAALNGTAVELYDDTTSGSDHSMNITVTPVGINNVEQYEALSSLLTALESNSVLGSSAAYSFVFGHLHENPATTVYVEVDTLPSVYEFQESPTVTMRLSASPKIGRNVTIHISPVNALFQFSTSRLVIAWPSLSGTFTARALASTGVSSNCGINVDAFQGSDDASRYRRGDSINSDTFKNLQRESVSVAAVAGDQRLYTGRASPPFALTVQNHRDTSFDLVVAVQISPSGLTADPANVSITAPNTPAQFTVTGNPGTYTISYLVGHVYFQGGTAIGASNPDFLEIPTSTQITVQPTMNASASSHADAYFLNPVTSADYGGAYSQAIPYHLERDPVSGTLLTVTPSVVGSATIEFSPSSVTFFPGGSQLFTFTLRAHETGVHQIQYALSGSGAGDYFQPHPTRRWIVHGRNPRCFRNSATGPCFAMPGCIWNEAKSLCSNGTLPIGIDSIPLLYDNEESSPLNFTLPTAVRGSLTITFVAASRLTFNPPSMTLSDGESTGTFTITAALNPSDGVVKQDWQMRLTGTSANLYDEQQAYAYGRPKVTCTVSPPPSGFFTRTVSEAFELRCDTSPETEVIFRPVASMSGIVFVPAVIDARDPEAIYFSPGQTSALFYANSTDDERGTVTLSVDISGVNAPRYNAVPTATFRVLVSGTLNIPPRFHMTAYETSQQLNLDLSVAPSQPLNVTIRPVLNDTTPADVNITVNPSIITFNNTQRASINITARSPGWFYLTFSLSGANVGNYLPPTERLEFEVKDPLSGKAFDARLRPGFLGHRRTCRVSVGRQSTDYRGQAPIDRQEDFCELHPTVSRLANETYDCGQHATEERCRNALGELGHACAWHQERCVFLPSMQGNIMSYSYGSGFTAFLTAARDIYTIGVTRYGQLGHFNDTLTKVPGLPNTLDDRVEVISAGTNHMMVLTTRGVVYTWGANQVGQLGLNTRESSSSIPRAVTFPGTGENITCISSGALHLAAVSLSGNLYMWGSNAYGQLGTAASFRSFATGPIQLRRDSFGGDAIIAILLGEFHSMAATSADPPAAYTWGMNTMGQLGRAGYDDYVPAQPVNWVRNQFMQDPGIESFLLGRNCPA